MTDEEKRERLLHCQSRIRAMYQMRGRLDSWSDEAADMFADALELIPCELWLRVVKELSLNPPHQFLPQPADLVNIARRMCQQSSSPSEIVAEIYRAVRQFGAYGVKQQGIDANGRTCTLFLAGQPPLSEEARQVIAAMNGWQAFCESDQPESVLNGLLLKHAQNVVEQRNRKPLFATAPRRAIAPASQHGGIVALRPAAILAGEQEKPDPAEVEAAKQKLKRLGVR